MCSQAVIDSLDTDPAFRDLLVREDAAILHAATDLEQANEITRSLDSQGLLVPGAVLVLSPYSNSFYAPLDVAIDRFSLQKWTSVSMLCAYLGAQSISVEILEDTETNTSVKFDAGGSRFGVGASTKGASKALKKFMGQMSLNDTYTGGQFNIEQAETFLETSGLVGDPVLRSLIDARSFSGNMLAQRRLTIDLSKETQRTVEAALEIKVPTFMNVGATFEQAKKSLAHYRLTLSVTFPNENS